jgi:hypothetical protein
MEETPDTSRQQMTELVRTLSIQGVPDTVAYVTESEVHQVADQLASLGYDERDYGPLFQGSGEPISFVITSFR